MRTLDDTAEARNERMLRALAELELAARNYSETGGNVEWPRLRLAKAALAYSRTVRRLAGVR